MERGENLGVNQSSGDAELLSLARELIRTARPAEAERLLRRALADAPDRAGLRIALAESLLVQGRLTAPLLVDLERLARNGGAAFAGRALGMAARGWTQMGDNTKARAAARRALEVSGDDPVTTINALIALGAPLYDQARMTEAEAMNRKAASIAEESSDPDAHRAQAHMFHGLCQMWLDDLDGALATWLKGETLASEAGDSTSLPSYFFLRGYALFLGGRLSDAAAEIETALTVASEIGSLAYTTLYEATLARIRLHMFDLREAGELLASAEATWEGVDHRGDAGFMVLSLRSEVHEAEQDNTRALSGLLEALRIRVHEEKVLSRIMAGPDVVRLAMLVGDRDLAREWAILVDAASQPLGTGFGAGCRHRAHGWLESDPDLLEQAVRDFRSTPRTLATARAEEDLGLLCDGDRAVAYSKNALASYEQMGAARDAARVLARLRALGVRPGVSGPRDRPAFGPLSLTPTEKRVAGLMLDGLSYPAIGKRLFISHRTVETHAAHIFQKLGIDSRRKLAGAL